MDEALQRAVAFFRRAGYWRSTELVDAGLLAAVRAEVDRLAHPGEADIRLDAEGRVTHVDGAVDRAASFRGVATDPAVLRPLGWLLGPNIELVRNRHNHATRVYRGVDQRLHRDVLQWSRPIVTAIVYLQDTPVEAGPTCIVPGSQYLPYVGTPNNGGTWMDEHHVFAGMAAQEVALPMPAGGVLFFDSLAFHRAGVNNSDQPREAVTFGYRSVDELSTVEDPALLLVSGERLRRGNPAFGLAAS